MRSENRSSGVRGLSVIKEAYLEKAGERNKASYFIYRRTAEERLDSLSCRFSCSWKRFFDGEKGLRAAESEIW